MAKVITSPLRFRIGSGGMFLDTTSKELSDMLTEAIKKAGGEKAVAKLSGCSGIYIKSITYQKLTNDDALMNIPLYDLYKLLDYLGYNMVVSVEKRQ